MIFLNVYVRLIIFFHVVRFICPRCHILCICALKKKILEMVMNKYQILHILKCDKHPLLWRQTGLWKLTFSAMHSRKSCILHTNWNGKCKNFAAFFQREKPLSERVQNFQWYTILMRFKRTLELKRRMTRDCATCQLLTTILWTYTINNRDM